MAYTLTLPTLKLPSGDLVVSFYCTGTSGTTSTLTHSYITDLGEVNKEIEIKGGELLVSSMNLSVWDKGGDFRYKLVADLKNDYKVKATFVLSGTTIFVGVIDKFTIKTEQKYLTENGSSAMYVTQQDDLYLPVEVVSFTVKDVVSELENISIKTLTDRLDTIKGTDNYWTSSNGVVETNSSQKFWYITVKQLLREIFFLLQSDVIKIGVQVEDNILSAMSHNRFDSGVAYNMGTGTTLFNLAINKASGLDDLYLIFTRSVDGKGDLFKEADYTTSSTNNHPEASLFNLNNCLEVVGKIAYTFGLIIQMDYSKKSIHSVSINSGGTAYSSGVKIASLLGGGGQDGEIYFEDASSSDGEIDTYYLKNNGINYSSAPTILIPPPSTGGQATATAIVSSSLSTVTGFSGLPSGSSYISAPSVVIQAPPNSAVPDFTFEITSGAITGIFVPYGGSGYRIDNLPSIDISKPLSGIKASISILASNISGGRIDSVNIISGGSGYSYSYPPTIYIDAPPTPIQATATATVSSGQVSAITITNAGSGYLSGTPPTVYIAPPSIGNSATATCSLSDFDVYFKKRDAQTNISSSLSNILDSSLAESSDSYIDAYEISSAGYNANEFYTTKIDLLNFPKSKSSNETAFGLLNWNNTNYGSFTDNQLHIEAQYESDGTSDAITSNKYTRARFIHDNINYVANTTLATSSNWTTSATHEVTNGVWSGHGRFVMNMSDIPTWVPAEFEPPTDEYWYVGSSTSLIGNLNKTIIGEPIVFSCWVKKTYILTIGGDVTDATCSITVELLDSSDNVIKAKNFSNTATFSLDIDKLSSSEYVFFNCALEPLDLNSQVSKVKVTFSLYKQSSVEFSQTSADVLYFSAPQLFVGAETISRWLVNRYMKYFSDSRTMVNRKYYGLISSNINIGDYFIDNGEVYYIKRISKNLVDNETEIEAINYST